MSLCSRKSIIFNPGIFWWNREAMTAAKHLELYFALRTFLGDFIAADIAKEVSHYDAAWPDIHGLVVMLFINYYFGRTVKSCADMCWKSWLSVEDGLFYIVNILDNFSLQLLHVMLGNGAVFHSMWDKIGQKSCGLRLTVFHRIN